MDDTDRTLDAVGPRLKQLRLRRQVTLSDLAAQTGISTSTLSRLETGVRRPTLEQLLPLARAYGVTLDELVDWDLLNDGPVRLSVGAVDIESGNFCYFDTRAPNRSARIDARFGDSVDSVGVTGQLRWQF